MSTPIVAQKGPYEVKLEGGKTYYWCACGRSKTQPFCDGSHQEVGLAPKEFKARKTGTAWLCGCKSSNNAPYCDGTHDKL